MGNKPNKGVVLPDLHLKMVLIGPGGAGKSSVFGRITSNQFSYHYNQTTSVIIGSVVKKINVPAECLVSLSLWDLPGHEDMDLRRSYYMDIDAAVVVVNINDIENISEVNVLKQSLIALTETKSKLATFELVNKDNTKCNNETTSRNIPGDQLNLVQEDDKSNVEAEKNNEIFIEEPGNITENYSEDPDEDSLSKNVECEEEDELIKKLIDLPTLLLGSKVDELLLDGEQEELHPKVKALSDVCEEANCTGWVPVSAKHNDRSIDLAFTSFLRYLVGKKLQIEQSAGVVKGLGMVHPVVPLFVPPATAATRLRESFQPQEEENYQRLPPINHEPVDTEYQTIRNLIGKVRRGHKDWNIAYRRFRKYSVDYKIATPTSSIEELILNIKEKLPENCLKGIKFQGWIKLELDPENVDMDQLSDEILEIIDTFNYELFPNASYVATTMNNSMITISQCKDRLSSLNMPSSSLDQVMLNNKEILSLLRMCESATSEVSSLRKAIEVALLW